MRQSLVCLRAGSEEVSAWFSEIEGFIHNQSVSVERSRALESLYVLMERCDSVRCGKELLL